MIEIAEILYRWVSGFKIKEIVKSLGYARNTIKSVIRQAESIKEKLGYSNDQFDDIAKEISANRYAKVTRTQDKKADILASYDQQIAMWLEEKFMTITQIHRLIKERGVEVSETSLRRYIESKFNKNKNYTIPLMSKPAKEAQVDYGYVGLMYDALSGKMRKSYAFIMTLSYSRYRFVQFVFSQDIKSWVECHINAFKFFRGVPKTILLDNLKAGIIKADIYDPTINRTYSELERFYGFVADPAKVRKPEHKGKVERSVLIVKQQLIAGRKYNNIQEANVAALEWCQNVNANKVTRTSGKTPAELFIEEKGLLSNLPQQEFDISTWVMAKVHKDHHIVFQGNFYSVPTKYIGAEVWVRGGLRTIDIYYDNNLIKSHVRVVTEKGKWQTDENDYPSSSLKYLHKTPEKCIQEAGQIGDATKELISIILKLPSKQRLRKAQAILRLQEKFGVERLENACLKSFVYENYSYLSILTILKKGIEEKTQEETPVVHYHNDYQGAYLRPAKAYKSNMEVHHE